MSVDFIDLKVNNAEKFFDSLSGIASDNVYLTFGKVTSWANDASPNVPNTMPVTVYEVWNNMIGGKRISGNDVYQVIKRNDWTANTVYDEYDQLNPNLYDESNTKFYILTGDYNVYKCIYNNNGANSTIEPTSVNSNNVVQLADGYIWKYMYTLTTSERLRFTTNDYIPVKFLTVNNSSQQWNVQESAIPGAILAIKVTDSGNNYTNVSNLIITITGDGTGAIANGAINNVSNTISSIDIYNQGINYTEGTVSIIGGGGTNAAARLLIGPPGGHGSNPVYELGGHRILLNPRINSDEGSKLPTTNEFRQIALIKNPLINGSNVVSSNTVISQTLDLTVAGSGIDYIQDEIVYQGRTLDTATFSAIVHSYDSSNNILKTISHTGTPSADTLYGANSTASKFVSSVTYPDLAKYTGRLLYLDNILPIQRAPDQTEDFRIIMEF